MVSLGMAWQAGRGKAKLGKVRHGRHGAPRLGTAGQGMVRQAILKGGNA